MHKKALFFSILYLVFVVIFITCNKESELSGGIHGIVTDNTGKPIQNAVVQLNLSGTQIWQGATGSDGHYEVTELKAGEYTLYTTKTGYADYTGIVKVQANNTALGDVQLEKLTAALCVVDANGQDINSIDFGENQDVLTRSFSIFNDSPESLEWLITKNCVWITEISKKNGTLQAGKQQPISITIDRTKLGGGNNTTVLNITSDNGSKELTVTAFSPITSLPTLNTLSVTNITSTTATFNGQITATGQPAYTERGFVYSTSSEPTIENAIEKLNVEINSNKNFSKNVSGLTLGQRYYVRAYAINTVGTAYSSNETSFVTTMTLPIVTTQAVTNKSIANGTAIFNGTIENGGDPAYTERGFVYSISHNPDINDIKKVVSGNEIGVFSANTSGLQMNNVYYVRAFATNAQGTAYGTEVICNFNAVMPSVTTQAATNIAETTATFNGTIGNVGDPAYTERGFVYSTTQNPTIAETKYTVSGNETGTFSANITGLTENKYYVRAYTTNYAGTIYGTQVSVTLANATLTGTLKDQDGIALENISVKLYSSFGTSTSVTTNSQGVFEFSNKIPGSYSIRVWDANNYSAVTQSITLVSGNNSANVVMNITSPFDFDDGYGIFTPTGSSWQTYFECNNTSLPGTNTTKTIRIKNNRQISLSWSITNRPTYGITYSSTSGNIAAGATVSIMLTFTYPTNVGSQTGRSQINLSGCTGFGKTYVWNWSDKSQGYVSGSTILLGGGFCSAFCYQNPVINIGNNSESFTILFNQFIVWQ